MSAASLLVVAVWVFSYFRGPWIVLGNQFFGLAQGQIVWQRFLPMPSAPPSTTVIAPDTDMETLRRIFTRRIEESQARMQLDRVRASGGGWGVSLSGWGGVIAVWPFAGVLTLAAAALWRSSTRAHRLERAGHCPACGYNRRGLAAEAKCPECGTVLAK